MDARLALAIANGVIGKLGEIAAEKALNEVCLLLKFKTDFKWLEKQLSQICASLQAADQLTGHNEPVKKWLAEVRNIFFDAEDIVDECSVEHLYTNTSQSCVCNCSQLVFRYKMGTRIKELKGRISSTIEEAQRLKLFHDVAHLSRPSTSTSTIGGEELRRWDIFETNSPAVAIDHKVDEILTLLDNPAIGVVADNPAIGVVAVVGMGGLGKTFLLQHVYDRTKHRYDCSAWITISQTCSNLRSLQCDLAYQINLQLESGITDRLVAQLIHDKLEGKRCLIVLDDVWTSVQDNLISGLGLPSASNRQCKIVVTTRRRDVVQNMSAHIYEMQHLSKGESWDLFCLYAFPDPERNRPSKQLESLARQVAEECGRLPLALKTVAASMAKSSLITDWESKLGKLKKIGKTEDSIMKILKLSYDSLSPNLKSCFASLSFFPEDTYISFSPLKVARAIHQDCVIYLWIAEGYIPQEEDREQWDIGLGYLHQFENLCLLEVNRVYSVYTLHDLLFDLAVNICKEHECEFDVHFKETICRRLLLAKKGLDTNAISKMPQHCQRSLRTLSLSQNPAITSIPEHLFDHVRVLRVIDLSRTAIYDLPKCVGKLKLLKVLNLSHTEIRAVPECVRRLKSLQFLDVSYCKSLQRVPDWIGELKCLSYLNVEFCSNEVKRSHMPKGIS
ncbi:putative disease resistance protein RGA3 [Cryptomeria japonica]|uniref:putative disease resistance protein RGA3 n=1 Tax=Cryptomeria japonica TaxID=3369 RepID=UPI0027D9EA58|nr:putative disease resistance protein RGA3 [Cryptomeria japonica]